MYHFTFGLMRWPFNIFWVSLQYFYLQLAHFLLYILGRASAALTIEPLLGGEEDGEHDAAGHLPVLLSTV